MDFDPSGCAGTPFIDHKPNATIIAEYRTAAPDLARLVLRYERILAGIVEARNAEKWTLPSDWANKYNALKGRLARIESDMKEDRSGDMDT